MNVPSAPPQHTTESASRFPRQNCHLPFVGIIIVGGFASRQTVEPCAAAADQSVRVVAIGHAINILDLLMSGPDDVSSLSGHALVVKKVQQLVWMGGSFLDSPEFAAKLERRKRLAEVPAAANAAAEGAGGGAADGGGMSYLEQLASKIAARQQQQQQQQL